MKFSIIYAMLRPEIQEKISVGLVAFSDNGNFFYRYSERKMSAVKLLMSSNSFVKFSDMISNFDKKGVTLENISYMSRYSNNLLSVSAPTSILTEYNDSNLKSLYSLYVDKERA